MNTMAEITKNLEDPRAGLDMDKLSDVLISLRSTGNNDMIYAETGVPGSYRIDLSDFVQSGKIAVARNGDGAAPFTAQMSKALADMIQKRMPEYDGQITVVPVDEQPDQQSDKKTPSMVPPRGYGLFAGKPAASADEPNAPTTTPKHKI